LIPEHAAAMRITDYAGHGEVAFRPHPQPHFVSYSTRSIFGLAKSSTRRQDLVVTLLLAKTLPHSMNA
jgi:hypothetical protein